MSVIKYLAGLLSLLLALTGSVPPVNSSLKCVESDTKAAIIQSETEYLNSLSQANGALPMTAPHYDYTVAARSLPSVGSVSGETYRTWNTAVVNPYFSAIAALGMLKANPAASKTAVEGFINWYFGKLNTAQSDICGVDGTVYDYRIFINPQDSSDIVEITTREFYAADFADQSKNTYCYDSTDSYAATFLSVLAEYARVYDDKTIITSHAAEIDRVKAAMLSTYVSSLKLTAAKPNYAVCYLMDNCEVYAGLKDAQYIYSSVLNNSAQANDCSSKATNIQKGIKSKLFNIFTWNYYAAVSSSGTKMYKASASAIKNFYPEGAAQLYPIIFGVINSDSLYAKSIYKEFKKNFGSDWSTLAMGGFPWAIIGRACAEMGDYDLLQTYLENIHNTYISQNHKYPYYNAEAGSVLISVTI